MDFTPEQLMRIIGDAIADHEFMAAIAALKLLAIADPYLAEDVYLALLAVTGSA